MFTWFDRNLKTARSSANGNMASSRSFHSYMIPESSLEGQSTTLVKSPYLLQLYGYVTINFILYRRHKDYSEKLKPVLQSPSKDNLQYITNYKGKYTSQVLSKGLSRNSSRSNCSPGNLDPEKIKSKVVLKSPFSARHLLRKSEVSKSMSETSSQQHAGYEYFSAQRKKKM